LGEAAGMSVSSIRTPPSKRVSSGWGREEARTSVTENNSLSPVAILDEFAVLIGPDISSNTKQTAMTVSMSSSGSQEDVLEEVRSDAGISQRTSWKSQKTYRDSSLTKLVE
jgi:hypothetical protein